MPLDPSKYKVVRKGANYAEITDENGKQQASVLIDSPCFDKPIMITDKTGMVRGANTKSEAAGILARILGGG